MPPYGGVFAAWCSGCRSRGTLDVAMSAATAESCPATQPASGPPPGLTGTLWHGNKALWAFAREKGDVVVPPDRAAADGSVGTKMFWFADGFVPVGSLILAGERIDAPSPPLIASEGIRGTATSLRGSATWATRVTFPLTGCWRLRARVADLRFVVTLSFVMKVAIG
jgi:hypothetical protein